MVTMDIRKLTHIANFNFNTVALGELRCGPLGNELSKFDKMAREGSDSEEMARRLVLCIAHKLTGDADVDEFAGGPAITEVEVALLLRPELDEFCDKFVARRLRGGATSPDGAEEGKSSAELIASGCDALGPAIIAHTNSQRAQMERILGQGRSSILSKTAFEALGKDALGNSVGDLMKKFNLGETIADQVRKFTRVGGVVEQMQRDVLKGSVLDSAFKTVTASDKLGESIAALRANSEAVHTVIPVQPPVMIDLPRMPPNPVLETNKLLQRQQAYAEEMRPTIIRAAELIQTLTDTTLAAQALANDNTAQAERHAQRSMWVAVCSILIAVITGGFSIYYANLSPTSEQLEHLAKEQKTQFSEVTKSAQADNVAREKNVADDREKLILVATEQLELLKSLRTAGGKSAQTHRGARE